MMQDVDSTKLENCKNPLAFLQTCLRDLTEFINKHKRLVNSHNVDLLVDDLWSSSIPANIQQELLGLTDDDLVCLPNCTLLETNGKDARCSLLENLRNIREHSVMRMGMTSKLESILRCDDVKALDYFPHIQQFMSEKKCHEVNIMAKVIHALAAMHKLDRIIDCGSGKGYLSTQLAFLYGLHVLGIEGSMHINQQAKQREQKLTKYWQAILRQNGLASNPWCDERSCSNVSGTYAQSTSHINEHTVLGDLIKGQKEFESCQSLLLCGLHTCGTLTNNILKMFVTDESAKVLCIVGCCYHMVSEQFAPSKLQKKAEEYPVGFPMSNFLTTMRFYMGRNARLMSSQAVDRIVDHQQLPSEGLYFRALLQLILKEHGVVEEAGGRELQIGRLYRRCSGFHDYVKKSLEKLNLQNEIQISDGEIEEYLKMHSEDLRKIQCFFQYRMALAPCIEAAFLLDRLCFLHEQENVKTAHIVPLFDPVKSPRRYALIAFKHDAGT